MKIIYDNKDNVYVVKVENLESVVYVNTDDIVEVRNRFIERMTKYFNDAISRQCKG